MILIITRSFPPEIGGIQSLMWGLSKHISKYRLTKVITNYHKNFKNTDNQVSFSIDRIKGNKLILKYRKSYYINNFIKQNPNIKCIIADHWKSLELIKSNKKKICLIHSKEINHEKGTRLNSRVLKVLNNVEVVVANSNLTKNLAENVGINTNNIRVIHPGVNKTNKISKNFINEADKIIGKKNPILITVARLEKRKNHERVIMALKNLKQLYPNILYICIGYGEEKANLLKLSKELNIESQVKFLSDISSDLKNALISKSNLFVMPSIIFKKSVEGFGISYIEAAQHGVPSIGGKDGGESDAIVNNETGLICDGNNIESIYSGIDNILKNDSFEKYKKNSIDFAKKFEWENIIKEYLKIL